MKFSPHGTKPADKRRNCVKVCHVGISGAHEKGPASGGTLRGRDRTGLEFDMRKHSSQTQPGFHAARIDRGPELCSWRGCESESVPEDVPLCHEHLRRAWAVQQVMLNEGIAPARPQPEQVPDPHTKEAVGWVYFAQVGPHVKIGWSQDPHRRMSSLGANALYVTIPNKTRADESAMHKVFEACRDKSKGREYFHPAPALMRYIRDLQTKAA